MHRELLLTLLDHYDLKDKIEIENKEKIIAFVKKYDKCFERSLSCGHITGSCWLENSDRSKFLLTKHKKIKIWLQLGGHADGNSNIIDVAMKEAHEESGLKNLELVTNQIFDIGIHLIPEYKGIPEHYHYDIRFLLRASDKDEKIKISDESDDLQWFNYPPTDNIDVNRMYQKWKAIKNQSNLIF